MNEIKTYNKLSQIQYEDRFPTQFDLPTLLCCNLIVNMALGWHSGEDLRRASEYEALPL